MARLDDPEIVDARDVDAVPDQLDQVVHRLGLPAGERKRERERSPAPFDRRRRAAGRLLRASRPGGAGQVPDCTAQDAVLDQRHASLGDPFEIELLWQAARVQRVIRDRDFLVEAALAQLPCQVTALLEQRQAAERVVGEVLQQLADRIRAKHGPV